MEATLQIMDIDNGWLLNIDEAFIAYSYEEDIDKYKAMENLLWGILEQLCPNSKHNPYRIEIKRKKNVTHKIPTVDI